MATHNLQYSHLKPVNGTTVNERGEHPQSVPKSVPYRAHGQYHMEVLTDTIYEVVVHGKGRGLYLLALK